MLTHRKRALFSVAITLPRTLFPPRPSRRGASPAETRVDESRRSIKAERTYHHRHHITTSVHNMYMSIYIYIYMNNTKRIYAFSCAVRAVRKKKQGKIGGRGQLRRRHIVYMHASRTPCFRVCDYVSVQGGAPRLLSYGRSTLFSRDRRSRCTGTATTRAPEQVALADQRRSAEQVSRPALAPE